MIKRILSATALCAALLGLTAPIPALAETPEDQASSAATATAATLNRPNDDVLGEINQQIEAVKKEIAAAHAEREQLAVALDRKSVELSGQQARVKELNHSLVQARRELEARFQNSLKDRGVHLDQDLRGYWEAVAALDNERANEAAMQAEHQGLTAQLGLGTQTEDALSTRLEELRIHRKHIQLRTALRALQRQTTVEYGATVECAENMTLRRCADSSTDAALTQSTERFRQDTLQQVLADLGSTLDAQALDLGVEVTGHEILDQHFEGAASHHSRLRISMRTQPDRKLACQLVEISPIGCTSFFAYPERANAWPDNAAANARWAPLTIRSNVFNDEVLIDGNSYGPTPVTVSLPTGRYQVEVRKEGFENAKAEVALNRSQTLRMELTPTETAAAAQ